ncbi:MAG: PorV/PorQ family protein [candidate division Zixibacteria bacterium]|nr:PorV/PorQ family protein [candidate division Zixibacteria bacterium]
MRKAISILMTLTLLLIVGAQSSHASGVSSAAVLFLRIAAGARAAGMGEAFVAVADDATATHWNPAGLGTYPLSYEWVTITVPTEYRPLKKIALIKGDASGNTYGTYDIWALSDAGLLKYSEGKWVKGAVIETGAKESAEMKLRQYVGLSGDIPAERLEELMSRMGRANNKYPFSRIEELAQTVLPAFSADTLVKNEVESTFVEMKAAYNKCMINWDEFGQAEERFREAYKDSMILESESDRVLFALQKAIRKYMPGELHIPFDINFIGKLADISADEKMLWVAMDSNLYRYNGNFWQHFGVDEGLPEAEILGIRAYDKMLYVRTDAGLVVYSTGAFTKYDETLGLPSKPVEAVAVVKANNVWAVVDNDLYHFDGSIWKNYLEFNDVLDESLDAIYERFQISGTKNEKNRFLAKYEALNDTTATNKIEERRSASDLQKMIDSVGVMEAFKATQINEDKKTENADSASTPIGRQLRIPYTAGIPYDVIDMEMDASGFLWVGTEYGLLRFNGRHWTRYGYRDYPIEQDISVNDLALGFVRGDAARAERLVENIKTVNELDDDILRKGQVIKMYTNPAGARINDISITGKKIYFATESGTIFFDTRWARMTEEGLGRRNTRTIVENNENLWFATIRQIKIRAAAQKEIAMMHVNWLPELADDIYYEFFSYVQNIPEWGTVGGNITFLSYGKIERTDATGTSLGDFNAFDIALTLSYGTPLTANLSGGISAKVIYSHLSSIGTGSEQGSGTSTGLALDVGLLYKFHPRWTLGMAVTNLGPDVAYIDVAQADPLPRNLAIGLATYLIKSEYNKLLVTAEMNKSLVGFDDSFSEEVKEIIYNAGAEYQYGSFIAFRGGYVYDEEGEVKTPTLGFGLMYRLFKFDFAYIPSSDDVPLANTMRLSLSAKF